MDISLGLALSLEGGGALTPPTIAPVLMVTTELGSDVAALSWTASDKTTSPGFYYDVEVDIDGGGYGSLTTTTNLTYNDTQGTAGGETYTYRITPHNDAGGGFSSNTVGVVLPGEFDAPTLTGWGEAADGADLGEYFVVAVNLDWNEITGATNYEIYRAENPSPYGSGTYSLLDNETLLEYRDSTVVWNGGNGPFYGYKIIATNGASETGYSNELVFAPAFVPPSNYTYLRPNGIDGYRRPGGTDLYIRP
jgi:fibronectin type 3 domain-containing protein